MNCSGDDNGFEKCKDGYMEFSKADRWIVSIFQRTLKKVESHFDSYRFDLAAQEMYQFVWDEYCDWYLEVAKVQLKDNNEISSRGTRRTLLGILETVLRMIHPIMPFISEEIWKSISGKIGINASTIMLQDYPVSREKKIDEDSEDWMLTLKKLVEECRKLRGEMSISPAQKLPLIIIGDTYLINEFKDYLQLLAKLESIEIVENFEKANAPVAIVDNFKLMFNIQIDVASEKNRLKKEINRITLELKKDKGIELFSGEFWSGSKSKDLGLIDGIGNANQILKDKFGDDVIIKKFEKSKGWLAKRISSENQIDKIANVIEERSIWQRYGL